MEEMLDVLDQNYQVIGQETRRKVHEKGLLHAAFQCWFFQERDRVPYLLFQKRAAGVNFPNLLDITAAGHLKAGEGPRDGAREIREEVGIAPDFADLLSLGEVEDVLPYEQVRKDRERCHVYAYAFAGSLDQLVLDPDEVDSVMMIRLADFAAVVEEPDRSHAVEGIRYDGERTAVQQIELALADFVPHQQAYYRFVLNKLQEVIR